MPNTQNTNAGRTEILCRLDREARKPVVFIANIMDGNQIQMWDGGDELKIVPLYDYQRTDSLAKADEDHIAARFNKKFKETAVVRHRLPRQQRERAALFATGATSHTPAPASNVVSLLPAPANKPAEQAQPQPQALATAPAATPAAVPTVGDIPASDLSSAELLAKITEEGAKLNALATSVATLAQQLQQATTDHDASRENYAVLTAQYHIAAEREAEEEKQRKEAALQAALAPLIALKQESDAAAEQKPQEAAQAPAETQQPAQQHARREGEQQQGKTPRGQGGKFVSKAKPIEQAPAGSASTVEMLKGLSPEQLTAIAAAAGVNLTPA